MPFLKMIPAWRQLRFLALCVISVSFLQANQDAVSQGLLMECVFRCLGSPSCGWVSQDRNSGQCLTHDFIDCNSSKTDIANNILVMYSRQSSELPIISTNRASIFKLFDTADTTCTTTLTSCDIPISVVNGDVEYGTLFPGSAAKYSCNAGFSFCGPVQKEVKCLASGLWENVGDGCLQDTWLTKTSTEQLQCPITFGTVIEIIGTPTQNTDFGVPLFGIPSRIVFYFEVRFTSSVVVFDTRDIGGNWEQIQVVNATTFPFQVGREFNVTILVNALQYDMMVDGVVLASFTHRYSIDEISSFSFWGDVDVRKIQYHFYY